MIPQGKYRIMAFKEWVPDRLRFWLLLFTVILFQFSNSIYLTNLNEVVGDKALTTEDVKLISMASFIGMTLIFPLLFRIKFRFYSRTILLTASAVVVVGNVICMYSGNVLVLLVTSLIVGAFRMIGTFEAFSSIQLVITPVRDFTVFFSVVYLVVLGSIQLSGLLTAEISYLYSWEYMHVCIVGAHLLLMITLYALMRPIRMMKKIPLYQIDWMGLLLWTLVLVLFNFVFEYGKRLDWFASPYISAATVVGVVLLALAIQRMLSIRRPLIMPEVFRYKNLLRALVLLALLQIFLSTSSTVLNAYTGGVLHFNSLHNASLNWAVFAGVVVGAAGSFYWLSVYRGSYKAIFLVGFLAFVLHHFMLYYLFQPSIPKEALYVPYALRGLGYVVLYISIALYAAEGIPFPHFFASLTVLGFVRTALGNTMANSLCANVLQYLQQRNVAILSQEIDAANPIAAHIGGGQMGSLFGYVNMQALLLSWKEIFGGITLFGIVVLIGIALTYYIKPTGHKFPKMRNIWKISKLRN
ncbi:transporter [Capnocytophaga sp. HP1101]